MSKHKEKKDVSLNVICPTCGAWKDERCKHTAGYKKGKRRDEYHKDRIALAKVKLSVKQEEKISKLGKVSLPEKKSSPKDKLTSEQREIVRIVSEKIEILGRNAEFVGPVSVGPIISTYRFFPVKRTKVAHLEAMANDFAVALGAEAILVKRMPGESAVGVFVPNKDRVKISIKDTLSNVSEFMHTDTEDKHLPIPINFGVDSNGNPFVGDLTDLPHLMIAGTTGGGKSTLLHAIVSSIGWAMSPKQVQLFISDTKGVEFKAFEHLPHLRYPISNNLYSTMQYFQNCIDETDLRLTLFQAKGVRNIHEFNRKETEDKRLPYIVFVIDEMADLMGSHLERSEAKANSDKLAAIVGRSRACGIYVIAATQRPDVKQIKGAIKANFSARLSFRLPSQADSKTILSTKGAEKLMSKGDMLYISSMSPDLKRLHAPYTSLDDTKAIIECIIQREADEKEAGDTAVLKDGAIHFDRKAVN